MIMPDDIAREVIRDRTEQAVHVQRRRRHPRAARALRGLADRIDARP